MHEIEFLFSKKIKGLWLEKGAFEPGNGKNTVWKEWIPDGFCKKNVKFVYGTGVKENVGLREVQVCEGSFLTLARDMCHNR